MSDSEEISGFKVTTIILSNKERDQIMPPEERYPGKRKKMPENWTYFMAKIIWNSGIKTSCAYRFFNGNIIENELKTMGSCSECNASFDISSKENYRKIILVWKDLGADDIVHSKKRTLTKTVRKMTAQDLLLTTSTVYRRQEATNNMKPGDKIPSFIANPGEIMRLLHIIFKLFFLEYLTHFPLGTYRKIASEAVKQQTLDSNAVQSIKIATKTVPFNDFIKTITIHPELIVEYFSQVQLEWYQKYSNIEYSCISIDATGGIIQSVKPPTG